jgi:DNA-binding transcriptional LysR family regulator
MRGSSSETDATSTCAWTGQLVFNSSGALLQAALQGLGLAYLTESQVQPYLSCGELVRVLADWCPPFSGYHLYYPSRRQSSPAFSLLVDALRYKRQRK